MLATEVRIGDAPKPTFSMKTYGKSKQSGNQPPVNHINFSLFLSLGHIFDFGYSLELNSDFGKMSCFGFPYHFCQQKHIQSTTDPMF